MFWRSKSWTIGAASAGAMVLALGSIVSLSAPNTEIAVSSSAAVTGGHQFYQIVLDGDDVVPPVTTDASARGWFVYSGTLSDMYYRVEPWNVVEPRKVSIYEASPGVNGTLVMTLWESGVSPQQFDNTHPLQGHVDLSAVQVDLLAAGSLYVVVTTAAHTDGELRGQIVQREPPTGFTGNLNGDQEVPPVDTTAAGHFTSTLNQEASQLSFMLTVSGLDEPMAAHVHSGMTGTNGPPELWLYDVTGANAPGGTFDESHPVSGTLTLSTDQLTDLVAGHAYVNVHTMAHSSGEIRAQLSPYGPLQPPTPTPAASNTPIDTPVASETPLDTPVASDTPGPSETPIDTPDGSMTPVVTTQPSATPDGTVEPTATGATPEPSPTSSSVPTATAEPPPADRQAYVADMHGGEEVPPIAGDGAARALFVVDAATDEVHFRIDVAGLTGIGAAHIHTGVRGDNGPPSLWLYDAAGVNAPGGVFDAAHPISGTLPIGQVLADAMRDGAAYVNVHTSAHGAGEVRGQVERYDLSNAFSLALTGEDEVPPVVTLADGSAVVTVANDLESVHAQVSVTEISEITQAHIHRGAPGTVGPPVAWLYDNSGVEAPGGPFDPANPLEVGVSVSSRTVLDILAGGTYLNVHSAAHPTGEIRGQIGAAAVPTPPPAVQVDQVLKASLSGSAEVPPVGTDAEGQASFVLAGPSSGGSVRSQQGEDLRLSFRLDVTGIDQITAAHLHRGSPLESGPVVLWLYDVTGASAPSGRFDQDHPLRRTVPISPELAGELASGGLYINVHTGDHTAGEIRGQVEVFTFREATLVPMDGTQETPPVDTEGEGQLAVQLDVEGVPSLSYALTTTGLDGGPVGAHLRRGLPGESGPVRAWLYDVAGVSGPDGNLAAGETVTGTVQLGEMDLADLLAGAMYANVRTTAHMDGEVRGQILVQPAAVDFHELALPYIEVGRGVITSLWRAVTDAIGGAGETGIQIQNLSQTQEATYLADFYTPQGNLAYSTSADVAPGAADNIWLPGTSILGGVYAGLVRSSQPMGAIVRTDWPSTGGAAIYSDVESATDVALPLVVRQYLGQSSRIAVQNVGSAPVSVTLTFSELGEPSPVLTDTLRLPSRGSIALDLDDEVPGLGDRYIGALLASATGPIALQAFVDIASSERAVYAFEGVPVSGAARTLYAPLFRAKQHPRAGDPSSGRLDTGISVVNPGAETATVTITYRGSGDRAASLACRSQEFTSPTVAIPPGSSHVFYQGDPASQGLPEDCFGSAIVNADVPVLAIVNDSLNEGATAAAYNAVASGARRVALPLYRREHVGLSTGIQAMNVGTETARVTITFIRQNADGSTTPVAGCGDWCAVDVGPGQAHTWWPPNQPAIEPGSFGAAVIESTQPLAVIVNDAEVIGARDMATYGGLPVAPE